jgi:calcyclin binding protein
MVVVFLAKSMTSKHWPHLIASEMKAKEPKVPDMDPNEDPSAGLMNLMKKMYEEGDDEMKRSIAKAWTEGREKNVNL